MSFTAYLCAICDGTFTEAEWDDRHSGFDGEDIHARCCDASGPCSTNDVVITESPNQPEQENQMHTTQITKTIDSNVEREYRFAVGDVIASGAGNHYEVTARFFDGEDDFYSLWGPINGARWGAEPTATASWPCENHTLVKRGGMVEMVPCKVDVVETIEHKYAVGDVIRSTRGGSRYNWRVESIELRHDGTPCYELTTIYTDGAQQEYRLGLYSIGGTVDSDDYELVTPEPEPEVTPLMALKGARELLADPNRWVKGTARTDLGDGAYAYCATGALQQAVNGFDKYLAPTSPLRKVWYEAEALLDQVVDPTGKSIVGFNDHIDTTHEQLIAVFDAAIAKQVLAGVL
jgi:hypothetical protein